MPGVNVIGGQSSKGFLHWLKNTWLGRFWNWIVSCFRQKNQKTELSSASEKQGNAVDDNSNLSQSPEVEQNEVNRSNILRNSEDNSDKSKVTLLDNSKLKNRAQKPKTRPPSREKRHNDAKSSSQGREKICEDVQKGDSGPSQIPVNPKSSAISRSPSEASLNSTSLSGSSANRLLRSQSLNDLSQASIGSELEWDNFDLNSTSSQPEAQGTSLQPQQNLSSGDTEEGKGNRQNTRRKQNASESGSSKTEDNERHREQVLKKKGEIDKENEKKGKETLKNSEEKQKGAEERRNIANKQKKPSVKNEQRRSTSGNRSVHSGSNPNTSLSRSNSSLSSSSTSSKER